MTEQPVSPCEYARLRYENIAKWRNLWTILLFVFGSSVVLFLILSIFLFIGTHWLPGALSTLGTIVTGASSKWVLDRRSDAVTEETDAFKVVEETCSQPAVEQAKAASAKLVLARGIR